MDIQKTSEMFNPDKKSTKCRDWANDIIWKFWDGIIPIRVAKPRVWELKILYESRKAHCKSCASHKFHGLAGVVKNNFSTSGEAASGEIIFYHNC